MWKRVFSLALSLILILTAAPFSGVSASAAYAEKGGEVQEALSGAYEQEEEISDAFIEETARRTPVKALSSRTSTGMKTGRTPMTTGGITE